MALCFLQHIKYAQDKETCEVLTAMKEWYSLGNNLLFTDLWRGYF